MSTDLVQVTEKYFECIGAGDIGVAELFHEDADLNKVRSVGHQLCLFPVHQPPHNQLQSDQNT